MAVNKITYAGRILIDLVNDTVTPETLLKGITAHAANGEQIIGTAESGGSKFELSSGTYSPTGNIDIRNNPINITHGLSGTPDFFFMMTTNSSSRGLLYQAVYVKNNFSGIIYVAGKFQGTKIESTISSGNSEVSVSSSNVTIRSNSASASAMSGTTYTWVAGRGI